MGAVSRGMEPTRDVARAVLVNRSNAIRSFLARVKRDSTELLRVAWTVGIELVADGVAHSAGEAGGTRGTVRGSCNVVQKRREGHRSMIVFFRSTNAVGFSLWLGPFTKRLV